MAWFRCFKQMKIVPDKGWCWVMLLASCVLMFLVFGVHYTYGILYPSLLKEFKKGEGKTAWVGSLSSGLMFLSSVVAIKMCDITSVTTTLVIGAIFSGSGLILTSIVTDFETLYFVYGVLFGVGSSFLYTPCLVMIGKWFHKYQAITTCLAVASSALGAVVLSPLIQHLIQLNGLRRAVKSCGIGYLSIALICAFCFKPFQNVKPTEDSIDNIDIEETSNNNDPESLLDSFSSNDEEQSRHDFTVNRKLFYNKKYVMFLFAMMITNFTYYMPIVHLVNYATHLGISPSSASLLISIWSASNIVGRLAYGKCITFVRPKLLLVYQVSMFGSGMVTLMAYFAKSYWLLVCYVVLYGFLDGSFIGLISLATLDITGLKDFAQGYGIMLTFIGIPIALGPPVIGMINDSQLLPPQFMFVLAGSLFMLGSILINFVRVWKNQDTQELEELTEENDEDITRNEQYKKAETESFDSKNLLQSDNVNVTSL